MHLGVDYYPEQWSESLIEEDMDAILEMGADTIRIGEFAWHIMEPREGEYDFSLFDRVIALAAGKGLKVIFGTPTATMPAWLAAKHPDVLLVFENGQRCSFGGRRQYCFNSAVYRDYTERIVTALASHYRDEKNIVAWQIDNELAHEGSDVCYCPSCLAAFRDFLKKKFDGDIDRLNEAYGTVFWSQQYNSFDEIPQPLPTISTHSPALRMDWERFRSVSVEEYCRLQYDLLKRVAPDFVVFHDFFTGCLNRRCDFSTVARHMDLAAYNNYPVWGGQKDPALPHEIAFGLNYVRGLKRRNFWITEAIMGAQGHDVTGCSPRPNQAKMWSYQAMAHGCSSLLYFRYRGAVKGPEQFCYGVIDADNVKGRKYREVQSFFLDIRKYEKVVEAPVSSRVCILYDYDSAAAFRIQRQSILLDYEAELKKMYKPFFRANVSVDVIASREDFSGYDVVVAPLMIVWTEEFQARMRDFVANGGTVVFTYRTAVKDADNNLTFGKALPVNYGDLLGVVVEQTESLQETDSLPLVGLGAFAGKTGRGGTFRDFLAPTTAETLFSYADDFYRDYAAVTVNRFGKGRAYYIGCGVDDATLAGIVGGIIGDAGIAAIDSPEGVEVVERTVDGEKYEFVLNHNYHAVEYNGETLAPFAARVAASQR